MNLFKRAAECCFATGCITFLGAAAAQAGEAGKMTREVWNYLPGSQITDFTTSPRYWQTPDAVSTFAGANAPTFTGNAFAARIRATLTAPATGAYTFWIASDDSSELWLSPTDSKFGRVRIASVNGVVGQQAWDAKPSQKSAPIQLVAGQRYFIEALHKDEAMADYLAIAWQAPGGTRELIPASALESFTAEPNDLDNDELLDVWETANGFDIADNGTLNPAQHPLADPDQDGYSNLEEAQLGTNPIQHGGLAGALLLETWKNLPGPRLADLTNSPRFISTPDTTEFIFSAETPVNRGDNFGFRLRGFVTAPVTGNYTFAIAGDDSCELWLSTSASQFAKRRVAWLEGFTWPRNWSKFPTQRSATIALVAGQKYYLEARGKEQGGGDHLSIGWTRPGVSGTQVIPASQLESYALDLDDPDGDNMPSSWESTNGLNPALDDAAGDPDRDGVCNFLEYESGSDPNVKNTHPGALAHEIWWNVPGDRTASLDTQPRLLQPADVLTLAPRAVGAEGYAEKIAQRLRGYLTAPVTGTYTFWAAGDDQADFFLSTGESQFNKELLIRTSVIGRSLDTDISQKSRAVQLVAGQRYYMEMRHINSHGAGYCDVAWQVPGGSREIIPGTALSSFIPTPDDLDDDGLPDAYELANGLSITDNGSSNPANGAHGDLDGDGLSNLAESKAGTRADLADTDGDGVNDREELEVLETQALLADAAPFELLQSIPGSAFTASSGSWIKDGGLARQDCVRGWLEYPVTIATAGVYQLQLGFTPVSDVTTSRDYEIVFSADGSEIQRTMVHVAEGTTGRAQVLTPWLAEGLHTIRVYLDNARWFRRVTFDQLEVHAARGPDTNANGTPDWIDLRLAKNNSLEAPAYSRTSPVCVEGMAKWHSLTKVNDSTVQLAPDDRWYADVPLSATQPTFVSASLENGALTASQQIEWIPTNLLQTPTIDLRLGDSLKLSAFLGAVPTSAEIVSITLNGHTHTQTAAQPLVHKFTTPGSIPIQVVHCFDGQTITTSSTITVVALPYMEDQVFVVGDYREINIPSLPAGVRNHIDKRVEVCSTNTYAAGNKMHMLRLNSQTDRASVFRLGDDLGSAIIGRQMLRTMRLRSGGDTINLINGEIGPDSWIVDMPVLLDCRFDVTVRCDIMIGGLTFASGSISESFHAMNDVDQSGIHILRFYKSGLVGSNCHRISVWHRSIRIAQGQ